MIGGLKLFWANYLHGPFFSRIVLLWSTHTAYIWHRIYSFLYTVYTLSSSFGFIGSIPLTSHPLCYCQSAPSDVSCHAPGGCSRGVPERIPSLRHSRGAPHALIATGAGSCHRCCRRSILPHWISAPPFLLTLQVYMATQKGSIFCNHLNIQ